MTYRITKLQIAATNTFLSFSCWFSCWLPCLSALTPKPIRAHSYTLPLKQAHSRACWCMNIYGRMIKAKEKMDNIAEQLIMNTISITLLWLPRLPYFLWLLQAAIKHCKVHCTGRYTNTEFICEYLSAWLYNEDRTWEFSDQTKKYLTLETKSVDV